MNLLKDMSSLRLAPTLTRELTAQATTFLIVLVLALVAADNPGVRLGLPLAYLAYAGVRVALVARRR